MDNDISNIAHWLWHVKNGVPILFRCDRAPNYGDEVRPIWYQNVHEKRRDRVWTLKGSERPLLESPYTFCANSHDGSVFSSSKLCLVTSERVRATPT